MDGRGIVRIRVFLDKTKSGTKRNEHVMKQI